MTFIYNTPIFSFNSANVRFRSNPAISTGQQTVRKDSFNSNPLYDGYANKEAVTKLAKSNPVVMQILRENKIPLKVNMSELEQLKTGHLMDTRITAAKIYSALPKEEKENINLMDLQQAALLHDYGKVLIPEKILNKKGKLTEEEKKIMELHSELGYELLKQQGVNQNVLNMVKYHHQTPKGDGYPAIKDDYTPDLSAQILAVADRYSALREKRSYKDAMTREEALDIIKQDVDSGMVSKDVYDALAKIV